MALHILVCFDNAYSLGVFGLALDEVWHPFVGFLKSQFGALLK